MGYSSTIVIVGWFGSSNSKICCILAPKLLITIDPDALATNRGSRRQHKLETIIRLFPACRYHLRARSPFGMYAATDEIVRI